MSDMGQHSEHSAAGSPLRRAHRAAWFTFIFMAGTTMTFQTYHSVETGQMPWPLAALFGIAAFTLAITVLEFSRHSPSRWARGGAYTLTAGAMYLSASATGDVVLHAAPPHASLLFGFLMDGAAILAIHFIFNGPTAAQAVAAVAQLETELRAEANAERSARQEAEANAARTAAEMREAHEANVQELGQRFGTEREALEAAGREAAEQVQAEIAALQVQVAGAEAARGDAEARAAILEAKTERLNRKLGPKTGRNSGANGSGTRGRNAAAATVPDDVDARVEALRILGAEPGISGAELGERCRKSGRWGQLRKKEFAGHVSEDGRPSETDGAV